MDELGQVPQRGFPQTPAGGGGGEEVWSGPPACGGLTGSLPVSPRLARV